MAKKAAKQAVKPAAKKAAAQKKPAAESNTPAKVAPEKAPAPTKLKPGQVVQFSKYADPDMPKAEKVFKAGEKLTVVKAGSNPDEYFFESSSGVKSSAYIDEVAVIAEAPAKAETKKTAESKKDSKPASSSKKDSKPASSSKKEQKAEDTEEQLVPFQNTPTVAKLLSKRDAHELAQELVSEANSLYFKLGGTLRAIKETKAYENVKVGNKFVCKDRVDEKTGKVVSGFSLYCDEVLKFTYRKAQYYIEIYESLAPMGVDEAMLGRIGWPQAQKIAKAATATNLSKLLKFASDEKHTGADLENFILELKAKGDVSDRLANAKPRGGADRTVIHVTMFKDKGKSVHEAFETAIDLLRQPGSDEPTEADALHYIATEWMTQQANANVTLEQMIDYIAQKFGVTVTVAEDTAEQAKGGKK